MSSNSSSRKERDCFLRISISFCNDLLASSMTNTRTYFLGRYSYQAQTYTLESQLTYFLYSNYVGVTFNHLVDDELILYLVENLLIRRLNVLHSVQLISLEVAISQFTFHSEHSSISATSNVLRIGTIHVQQKLLPGGIELLLKVSHIYIYILSNIIKYLRYINTRSLLSICFFIIIAVLGVQPLLVFEDIFLHLRLLNFGLQQQLTIYGYFFIIVPNRC